MTQHIELNYKDPVHQGFFDPIQEMLSSYASENLKVVLATTTSVKIVAGTAEKEVSIAIGGKYRFRTTETTAALPGGAIGECPIFVTASANDFTGPVSNPDEKTVYTFGLEIKKTGETPATALYRQIGVAVVAGSVITGLKQSAGGISGAQIEDGALSTSGDIEWTREPGGGLVPKLNPANQAGVHFWSGAELTRTNVAMGSFSTPIKVVLPVVRANQQVEINMLVFVLGAATPPTIGLRYEGLQVGGGVAGSQPADVVVSTTAKYFGHTFGPLSEITPNGTVEPGEISAFIATVEASSIAQIGTVSHVPLTLKHKNADSTNVAVEIQGKVASGTAKVRGAWLTAHVRG